MNEENKNLERFPDTFNISSFEFARFLTEPRLILEKIKMKLEKSKIVCLDCHDFVTFKFEKRYWTMRCKCGITIFYPPRKNRNYYYGKKCISREEYDKEKQIKEHRRI